MKWVQITERGLRMAVYRCRFCGSLYDEEKEGVPVSELKVCPVCNGRLVVSDFYTMSRDYRITKKGVLSKRCSTSDPGPLDCTTASCLDCNASWDADHVVVDADSTVWLKVEQEEDE